MFLEDYFSNNVRHTMQIKFMQLKQGNLFVIMYIFYIENSNKLLVRWYSQPFKFDEVGIEYLVL